jgi:hypothetical protein
VLISIAFRHFIVFFDFRQPSPLIDSWPPAIFTPDFRLRLLIAIRRQLSPCFSPFRDAEFSDCFHFRFHFRHFRLNIFISLSRPDITFISPMIRYAFHLRQIVLPLTLADYYFSQRQVSMS